MESNQIPQVAQAKSNNLHSLIKKPNVVGVGVGYKQSKGQKLDQLSVVCLVKQKTSDLPPGGMIPQAVGGVPTDVIQVGELTAFANTGRMRPAPGGVSIGHYAITAGTLGVVVKDRATGDRLILSNNHVLANSNAGQIGDAIIQPGDADGGRVATDTIAHLERFEPIQFSGQSGICSIASLYADIGNFFAKLLGSSHRVKVVIEQDVSNYVDAALARPINDGDVLDEILDIGVIDGVMPATLGMSLRKTGRTTGFTTGTVDVLDATVNVSYGSAGTARYDGQIVAGAMSQGGDSGSLVVDGNSNKAVGLLFAGSNSTTILNPIQLVLDTLNIKF